MALTDQVTHLMIHQVAPVTGDFAIPMGHGVSPAVGIERYDGTVLAAHASIRDQRQAQFVDDWALSEHDGERSRLVVDKGETGVRPPSWVVENRQGLSRKRCARDIVDA